MAFFARPNLDNTQFKQLKDSELTLSGQTQIATISGLTLATGNTTGTGVIITASGASSAMNNYVLTYDDIEKKIKLKEPSASGGTGFYPYNESATTTVGGLVSGQNLYNEPIVDILHDILVPTLNPTLTNPSISSLTLTPTTTIYEVGCSLDLCACASFSLGCINPQYTAACDERSNGVSGYTFNFKSVAEPFSCTAAQSFCCCKTISMSYGSNSVVGCVSYRCGVQPYDSFGSTYCSPLSAGYCSCTKTITGVYPYYWGTISCAGAAGAGRPDVECIKDEMTGNTCGGTSCGNKCAGFSNGTVTVNFYSTSDDYLWFAIPVCGGCEKQCWCESALNKGCIGGTPTSYPSVGSNLFPDYETVSGITAVGGMTWTTPQPYQVYISNYQTCLTSNIQLRNS